MLDLLEAGLAGLRLHAASSPSPVPDLVPAAALRQEMETSGLSTGELAKAFGISRDIIDDWIGERAPVPVLALTTIQILRRLTLSERRKLQNGLAPQSTGKPAGSHPFSRIEEL